MSGSNPPNRGAELGSEVKDEMSEVALCNFPLHVLRVSNGEGSEGISVGDRERSAVKGVARDGVGRARVIVGDDANCGRDGA